MTRQKANGWSSAWEQRLQSDCGPKFRDCVRHIIRYRLAGSSQSASVSALHRAALRSGLRQQEAQAWARSAGAARSWPGESANLIPACGDVVGLDRFVIQCETEATRMLALGPKVREEAARLPKGQGRPQTSGSKKRRQLSTNTRSKARVQKPSADPIKRTRNARLADLVAEANKRAKRVASAQLPREPRVIGARLPPVPGRLRGGEPERDHPDRPRGWETTDWINSKS